MKLITKEVRIGIAGIAALCLLVFGINSLKGINMFVRDIAYDYNQPENVIVEVEVDTDLRIPKGSSAE